MLRTYYYDTNPLDSTGFSQNTLGRLAAVQYANVAQNPDVGSTPLPIQMNDMYSYTAYTAAGAGLPAAKRLQVNQLVSTGTGHVAETANLDSTYTYNNEGKLTAISYPGTTSVSGTSVPGASYNYYYDSMYRLSSMTTSGGTTVVNGVSYNAANQLLGMTYNSIAETRGYNVLNQLTSLSAQENATTVENLTYNYPTGTNDGKISYMSNALSGEKISYTYDSLNRMIAASDSIGQTVQWAEGYTFDPFGNLTAKAVTGGTQGGPSLSVAISQVNNQIETYYYDANGNGLFGNATAYDVENHVSGGGWSNGAPVVDYGYDAQSRRFLMLTAGTVDSYGNANNYLVVEYSPRGQKLGTYQINTCNDSSTNQPVLTVCSTLSTSDQYFGGRRLAVIDPLGSAGTYYPWGEDKGSTNPQDTWSFATYWRDSATGLDYANKRYYSNAYGRFMTPDPTMRSANPREPQSWNRYAYVMGDPSNYDDPTGQFLPICDPFWGCDPTCTVNGFEDPDCGDDGSGQPPPPQPPPPISVFTGADIGMPQWATTTAGTGFFLPVVFNFVVLNGTGTAWGNTQTVNRQGAVYYLNGSFTNETEVNKIESLVYGLTGDSPLWTGDWAPVFDAPGEPNTSTNGSPVVSGTVTWQFQLNVSVFVSGYGWINCPQVNWNASETWTIATSGNTFKQTPTGSINVTTLPTP